MNALAHILLAASLTLAPAAMAADSPPGKISVQFRGSLRDGLREIASKGGINLVVTGDLDQPSEVYLKDVSAEEALATVAGAYHLKIQKKGSIWTLRPLTPAEREGTEALSEEASEKAEEARAEAEEKAAEAREEAAEREQEARERAEEKSEKLLKRIGKRRGADANERVGTGPIVIGSGEEVHSAVSYGGTVTLQPGAIVQDDAVAFGGDVVLEAGAIVRGDAVSFGGQVRKSEGALVEGDEVSMGGGFGAVVGRHLGKAAKKGHDEAREPAAEEKPSRGDNGFGVPGFLSGFALLFGLGFLFMMYVPARMKQIQSELKRNVVACGLTGFLGMLIILPLAGLLTVTIIGIPFAFALLTMAFLGVAMGLSVIATELGMRFPPIARRRTQALVLAVGSLILLIAARIPFVGPVLFAMAILVALGAIIRSRFGQTPKGFPISEGPIPGVQVTP